MSGLDKASSNVDLLHFPRFQEFSSLSSDRHVDQISLANEQFFQMSVFLWFGIKPPSCLFLELIVLESPTPDYVRIVCSTYMYFVTRQRMGQLWKRCHLRANI